MRQSLNLDDLGVYLSWHPDSYNCFGDHKEDFDFLYSKFIEGEEDNNSKDISRLWSLVLNCNQILKNEEIEGDLAEVGVYKGNSSYILAWFAQRYQRKMYLFDTFEGFDERDFVGLNEFEDWDARDRSEHFKGVSAPEMNDFFRDVIGSCFFEKGYFPDTFKERHKDNRYSIISIDCDLYEPIKASLKNFYPLMSEGGIFYVHDYSSGFWEGATRAVDEFCKETGEKIICIPDKSGSAFIRKTRF